MSRPVWITPGGNLGTWPELEFYSLPLVVNNPTGTPVTFSFLSGQLPPGLQVIKTGKLQGAPVITDPKPDAESRTYRFTIRATCQTPPVVVDRTFSFTVHNIQPPVILPEESLLGEFFDGTLITKQLYAAYPNPAAKLVWTIKDGILPPGVQLSQEGLIYGFIRQAVTENTNGRLGFDAQPTQSSMGFTNTATVSSPDGTTRLETIEPLGLSQKYQEFPYDFTATQSSNKNYTFTVQVYDGAKYDTQTYTVRVLAKGFWSTDNDINTIDDGFITTDIDQLYVPIIVSNVSILPTVRQNSNFSYQFAAVDFYNSTLTWKSNVTSLLPNLSINSATGWLNGHIDTQTEYKKTYTFQVTASNVTVITATYLAGGYANTNIVLANCQGIRPGMELASSSFTNSPYVVNVYSNENIVEISTPTNSQAVGNINFNGNLVSVPVNYKLTVLGDINNIIVWDTDTTVGTLINGGISELAINAHSTLYQDDPVNKAIVYKLVHGSLPDGSSAVDSELITTNFNLLENSGIRYNPTKINKQKI
jgi:hypothetical protein